MKTCQHTFVIIISALFLIVNLQGMAKPTIKSLEKEAWNQAFQGNTAQALASFTQAANTGSWQAAKLLAYNYGKESLFDQQDESKAQLFTQLAKRYKQKNPRGYFSEFDLTSNIEKFKALQFARIHPWYQQVLEEINTKNKYAQEYPLPEKSIIYLFDKMTNNETDKQKAPELMDLLERIVQQAPSKDALKVIFERINDSHRFRFSRDAQTHYSLSRRMIAVLDTSANALDLTQELIKTYDRFFLSCYDDYIGTGHKVEKTVVVDAMQELFPGYAKLDKAKAFEFLIHLLDHKIEYSVKWDLDNNFLSLLRLLPDTDLETYITNLSAPHRLKVIQLACKTKNVTQSFQGTVLDLGLIAKKALNTDLDEQNIEIITALLKSNNQAFYHRYEEAIIAVLPTFMEKANSKYDAVMSLAIQTDLPRLQNAALKALVDYTACMSEKECGWHTYIIEKMFENNTLTLDKKTELYQLMNTTYQATRCIRGLQILWMHIKDNVEQQNLLRSSLEQYFNVLLPDTCTSFEDMLQQALTSSQEYKTISQEQFLQTLQIAHGTDLVTYINPEFLALAKEMVIFDEHRPFQERATFLGQQLATIRYVPELLNFFQKIENSVIDEALKTYACTILVTLNMNSSSFEICKAKKTLQEIHKKYELKGPVPEIVRRTSGILPNFAYLNRILSERPSDHIVIDNTLDKPLTGQNGLLYALAVKNLQCSLWAIDGKTLDGVWQVPIHNYEHVHGKEPKFALHNDIIYLADGLMIHSFDSKTGMALHTYPLKGAQVAFLAVNASGLIYVVQADTNFNATVTTIDPNTGDCTLIESNVGHGDKDYFIAGQTFGYYHKPNKAIMLYANDGSKHMIEACTDKEQQIFHSYVAAKDNMIIFTKCVSKDNYCLVAYDANTRTQMWNFALTEEAHANPCVSPDGQQVFVINKNEHTITALKHDAHEVHKLWNFAIPQKGSLSFNTVNELAISPDGTTLFALNVYNGTMYTIHALTGELMSQTQCTEGRSRYLIGVSQDNCPYIHPDS